MTALQETLNKIAATFTPVTVILHEDAVSLTDNKMYLHGELKVDENISRLTAWHFHARGLADVVTMDGVRHNGIRKGKIVQEVA